MQSAARLIAAAAIAAAAPAAAHPRLLAASPAAGGAVAATAPLTLRFSERLMARFSGMMLSPATGSAPTLVTSVAADGKTLVGKPVRPLPRGRYLLSWHAVAADTHRVVGRLTFTVR